MSFSRRGRPLAEEEKSTDAAKARARAMELLAGQELSSGQLYERLGRKFTQPTAAAVVAEMVERQYVDDERYARTRAHGLLAARKSRRAAAQDLRQKGLDAQQMVDKTLHDLMQKAQMPNRKTNPLGWAQMCNSLKQQAEEMILPMLYEV